MSATGSMNNELRQNDNNPRKRAAPTEDDEEMQSNASSSHRQHQTDGRRASNAKRQKLGGQQSSDEDEDMDQDDDSEGEDASDQPSVSQPTIGRRSQYVDCTIQYPNVANPNAPSTASLRTPEQFMADAAADQQRRINGGRSGSNRFNKAPVANETAWWFALGPFFDANTPSQHLRMDGLTNYLGWGNVNNAKNGYEKKRSALQKIYPVNANLGVNDVSQSWKQHYEQHKLLLKNSRRNHANQPAPAPAAAAPDEGEDNGMFGHYDSDTETFVLADAPYHQMPPDHGAADPNSDQHTMDPMHPYPLAPPPHVNPAMLTWQSGSHQQIASSQYHGLPELDAYGNILGGEIAPDGSWAEMFGAAHDESQEPQILPHRSKEPAEGAAAEVDFGTYLWDEPQED